MPGRHKGELAVNETRSVHRLASALLAAVMLGLLAFGASPAGAADEKSASAGDVADGLKKLQSIAESTAKAAGTDSAKAAQLAEGIEPVWETIEGTLRSNDKDAYVTLEDNFTLLKIGAKAGDADKATKAATNLTAAVTSYLEKYPAPAGATAASEPEPSSATRSAAAAAATPESPLPRTGPRSASLLTASAGLALGLGGLATIGGARRHAGRRNRS
jgi:hypothetical protein